MWLVAVTWHQGPVPSRTSYDNTFISSCRSAPLSHFSSVFPSIILPCFPMAGLLCQIYFETCAYVVNSLPIKYQLIKVNKTPMRQYIKTPVVQRDLSPHYFYMKSYPPSMQDQSHSCIKQYIVGKIIEEIVDCQQRLPPFTRVDTEHILVLSSSYKTLYFERLTSKEK